MEGAGLAELQDTKVEPGYFLMMSLKMIMMIPIRNMKIEILLIPCIYFTHGVFGAFGSFFLI
jgi:hypothetical protein